MKTLKCIFTYILSTVIAFVNICGFDVLAEESEFGQMNLVFYDDGDSRDVGVKTGKNIGSLSVDEEHGKSTAVVSSDMTGQYYAYVSEPKACEAALISFDMNCINNDVRGYFELINEKDDTSADYYDNYKRMIYIRETGDTAIFKDMLYHDYDAASSVKRNENRWYHFDIWINYEEREVSYYLDKKFMYELELPDTYDILYGFRYNLETTNGGGTHCLDNVRIVQVMERGKPLDLESDVFVPAWITNMVSFEYDNPLGSNYFSKEIEYNIICKNFRNDDIAFELEVEAKTDNGITEFYEKRDVSVASKEKELQTFKFDAKHFGYHKIYITATDKKTGKTSREVRDFHVINGPADGVRNEKEGVNIHFAGLLFALDFVPELTEMVGKAGFGHVRDNYSWWNMHEGEQWFLPDKWRQALEEGKKNDVETMILSSGADIWNGGLSSHIPTTDEDIAKYAEYVRHVVEYSKPYGVNMYEIWNEFNLSPVQTYGSSGTGYTKILKAVYEKIKKYHPESTVIGLGSPTFVSRGNMFDYIEECLQAGAADYSDAFSIHTYDHSTIPELGECMSAVKQTKALFEKYGVSDKPVYLTEAGWSSHNQTEDDQANYMLRYNAMVYNEFEKITWYVIHEKIGTGDGEDKFGWVRAWDEHKTAPYEPFAAKPAFFAISNFNALLSNAEQTGKVEFENDEVWAYRYKRADGKDVLMIWSIAAQEHPYALNLGVDSVEVYDKYGNMENINAADGAIELMLSGSPQYIIGNFDKIEVVQSKWQIGTDEISMAADDYASLRITKQFSDDAKIEFDLPENIEVLENDGFINNAASIRFKSGYAPIENEKITVFVKSMDGTKTYAKRILPVVYSDDVTCDIKSVPFRDGRYQAVLTVKNNKTEGQLSGKIAIKAPEIFAKSVGEIVFDNLIPGEKRRFKLPLYENDDNLKTDFAVDVVLDNGRTYSVSADAYKAAIMPASGVPVIDGVLDRKEWNVSAPIIFNSNNNIIGFQNSWGGSEDLSGKCYLMWDKDYFYMGAQICDDILGDADPEKRIWANDSIQFSFAKQRKKGVGKTEYSIGLVNGEPMIDRTFFMTVAEGIIGVEDKGSWDDIEIEIKREENITTYEIKVPWYQIYGEDTNVAAYTEMYLSLLINENDGEGRRGYAECGSGIGGTKDPSLYLKMPVIRYTN